MSAVPAQTAPSPNTAPDPTAPTFYDDLSHCPLICGFRPLPSALALRPQARGVGRDINEVLFRELGDHWLHQIGPQPVSRTDLHVEQLPCAVTRRTPRQPGHRTHPFQIGTMTYGTCRCLAPARLHERLTLL